MLKVNLNLDNAALEATRFVEHELPKFPYPGGFRERGIVTVAGGMRYLVCAWVLIRMLRHVGCTLPIQVWHLGEGERNLGWEKLVAPYDVECIDAWALRDSRSENWLYRHRRLNGWEAKPYAIMHSRFEEVLLLDADNVPVDDPTYLFDAPEYRSRGAIFWPDLGRLGADRSAWKVFGDVSFRDEPEVESGQLVINKKRSWAALVLMHWYMQNAEFYFDHVHGDKEVFHLAWRKLNLEYAMPETPCQLTETSLYQHDFQGRRILQHRNSRKWSIEGNTRETGFHLEDECLAYLEEARRKWGPVAKRAVCPTPEDVEIERRLVGCRFHYRRIGHDSRPIVLAPGGRIGEGAAARERFWWLEDRQLVIAGEDKTPTMTLGPYREGWWVGRWHLFERMPVVLIPYFPEPYSFTDPYDSAFARSPQETTDRRHIYTLHELYRRLPPGSRCLEIGCLDGAAATAPVEAIRQGADISADFCDLAITDGLRRVLAACSDPKRIRVYQMSSVELLRREHYDVYYVEGDHSWAGVADELSYILSGRPLLFIARHTSAGTSKYNWPGATWFKMVIQSEPGYFTIEDRACRADGATDSGLLVATRDSTLFAAAQEAFARWLMA